MIKLDGTTVVLKCDCHHGGYEVTMAKISGARLTIISGNRHGSTHFVDIGIDKLQKLCNTFLEVEHEGSASQSRTE